MTEKKQLLVDNEQLQHLDGKTRMFYQKCIACGISKDI